MINLLNSTERHFPFLSKSIWKTLYSFFAWRFPNQEWRFMNYGYNSERETLSLFPEDEENRYFIQMYTHALSELEVTDRELLEVGCGRGGGSEWLARTQNFKSVTGVDLSKQAISLCQKNYQQPNLKYRQGDAEQLPFQNDTFDIVLNIESSHHYPSMPTFLQEVTRVLKPRGYLCLADYREQDNFEQFKQELASSNLELIQFKDITSHVVDGLNLTETLKMKLIQNNVPSYLISLLKTFAAVQGTEVYNRFVDGRLVYASVLLKKI